MEIRTIKEGIFRIRLSSQKEFETTLLSKYNIINEPKEEVKSTFFDEDIAKIKTEKFTLEIDKQKNNLTFLGGKHPVSFTLLGRGGSEYQIAVFILKYRFLILNVYLDLVMKVVRS